MASDVEVLNGIRVVEMTVWEDGPEQIKNVDGAVALMRQWGGGKGIPFYAVTDDHGAVILTSEASQDSGGYPGRNASIRGFRTMIDRAAPLITENERRTIAEWVLAPLFRVLRG